MQHKITLLHKVNINFRQTDRQR